MEEMITLLAQYFLQYGWQLGLIALLGIVLLGVLKYTNVFAKVEKENRKPLYLAISIGFSVIAAIVYLAIIGKFEINFVITMAMAIYALNQAMYAIYESTKLRDLVAKLLEIIANYLKNPKKE